MAESLRCPHCRQPLRREPGVPFPPPLCPHCGTAFGQRRAALPPPAAEAPLRLAEEPAPVPARSAGKPRKKKKKDARTDPAPRGLLLGAGALAGVLLLGVIGWLVFGRGFAPKGGSGGGGDAEPPPADLVTVTTSLVKANPQPPVPVPRLEPAAADNDPLLPLPPPPKPPVAPAPLPAGAALPADPAPAERPAWAERLVVPAARITVASQDYLVPPVIAGLGGRFAVFANALDHTYRLIEANDPKVPGRTFLTPNSIPKTPPPLELTDLSTGAKAGAFPGNVPLMSAARLSPDGSWLVTRAGVLPATGPTTLLDVWRKDAAAVAGQITIAGRILWMEFVAPTRLAVLVAADPDAALQVWDVAGRERIHALPLPGVAVPPRDRSGGRPLEASHAGAAVSAGGLYVAVGGSNAVVLVDVREGKVVGRLPAPASPGLTAYTVLGFLPETNTLAAVIQEGWKWTLLVWDLNTGRERGRSAIQIQQGQFVPLFGEVYPGPLPDTLLVAGVPPGLLYPGAVLLHAPTGAILHTLPYGLLGAPVKGRALAFAPVSTARKLTGAALPEFTNPEEKTPVTITTAFDPAALAAAAGPMAQATQPRPPVPPGDWAGVALKEPAPPAAWAAPPAAGWPKPSDPGVWLPEWPSDFAANAALILRLVLVTAPLQRHELVADRYDPATGKRLGPPQTLWPWVVPPFTAPEAQRSGRDATAPPAALSADGQRLAVVDPAERNRVDVWAAGGDRLGGFYAAAGQAIDWLGWSADGKLLTVVGGALLAWDAAAGKVAWAVHGGYGERCALIPGRQWGAFAGPGRIDLIDVADGKCLGRCRAQGLPAAFEAVQPSPDGKRLLAVAKSPAGAAAPYTGWVWDLATGAAERFAWPEARTQYKDLQAAGWVGPDQFVLCSQVLPDLFDLRAKAQVTVMQTTFVNRTHRSPPWFAVSPDGRLWVHWAVGKPTPDLPGPHGWQQLVLPEPAAPLRDPGREFVDLTKVPIAVEVALGDRTRSQTTAQKLADALAAKGFTIGPDGWRLRLTYAHGAAGPVLTDTFGRELRIPVIEYTWKLLSPNGTVAWSLKSSQGVLGQSSKYYKGSKADPSLGLGGRVENYDFGGQDPVQAVTTEVLEHVAQRLEVPPGLATWAVVTPGAAMPLPFHGGWNPGGGAPP